MESTIRAIRSDCVSGRGPTFTGPREPRGTSGRCIAEGGTCASPPTHLSDYAEFVGQAIELYGDTFEAIELWNEPNNRLKWNFREFDPDWKEFAAMVREASCCARERGKTTVLGGMIPVDHHWLELIDSHGGLDYIDVVGIHAFPGMWWGDHEYCWDWETHWTGNRPNRPQTANNRAAPDHSHGNASVDNSAFSACRESSRVCCTTIGTFDSNTEAKSVSAGTGSGSFRSLNRTCRVRRGGMLRR